MYSGHTFSLQDQICCKSQLWTVLWASTNASTQLSSAIPRAVLWQFLKKYVVTAKFLKTFPSKNTNEMRTECTNQLHRFKISCMNIHLVRWAVGSLPGVWMRGMTDCWPSIQCDALKICGVQTYRMEGGGLRCCFSLNVDALPKHVHPCGLSPVSAVCDIILGNDCESNWGTRLRSAEQSARVWKSFPCKAAVLRQEAPSTQTPGVERGRKICFPSPAALNIFQDESSTA